MALVSINTVEKKAALALGYMPKWEGPSQVYLKYSEVATVGSSGSSFSTYMAMTKPDRKGAHRTIPTGNTDKQLVIDVQGEAGILTHVQTPYTLGNQDVFITVTTDGSEKVYEFINIAGSRCACIGGFVPNRAETTSSQTQRAYDGGYYDTGWDLDHLFMLTPSQTVARGIGVPFDDHLKVEIQYSSGCNASYRYTGVTYATN